VTSRLAAAAAICVSAFALAYLAPSTGGLASQQDEGAIVAYAQRVLEGAVPHRDFLTFYGPANPWIVGGAFAVFGESVGTERAVGLAYRLVLVLSLFLIGLRLAGVVAGALAAVVATVLLGRELIWAFATYGALAFGFLGIALTVWAATANDGRRQKAGLLAGGLAGGAAVLVRFDFALAVGLAAVPLLKVIPGGRRWWYGGGLLAAIAVYAVHLALVGPERIARVASDLVASGPGRRLPRPPVTTDLGDPGTMFAASCAVLVLFVVVGLLLWWRREREPVPQLLVSVGLFGLALVPYVLSRPDWPHITPFVIAPLSLFPALLLVGISSLGSRERIRHGLVVGVAIVTLFVAVDYGEFTTGRAGAFRSVRHAFRGFEDDDSRAAARAVMARVRALARPGDSLFVGPQDLRRTNYGPTWMYFVLDELEPASYYMEMNPGTANREGSGLADELRRADWLILSSEWDNWDEPNESTENGPSEPNEVVRDEFCLRLERGEYRMYERCDRAA
jgi:hypothetical protein